MKRKATLLLFFLVAGQFLACLLSTEKMWPFNPILVYVEPVADDVTETSLVAFYGEQETNVVDLGWVDRRVEWRLVKAVDESTPEMQLKAMRELADEFRPMAGRFEGLRLSRSTWRLREGRVLEKKSIVEVLF
jgi:hypothetical protein